MHRRKFLSLGVGGVAAAQSQSPPSMPEECDASRKDPLKDYVDEVKAGVLPPRGHVKAVYRAGTSGPGILLLHEIPGLTPWDLALGRYLSKLGFRVYAPLLFGKPGQDKAGLFDLFGVCNKSEINCLGQNETGKIFDDITPYVEPIKKLTGGKIGVVGMCLTGAFPLAMIGTPALRPHIACTVLAQPTIPTGLKGGQPVLGAARHALGISPQQLLGAKASGVPILGLRYVNDPYSTRERMERLEMEFEGRGFCYWRVYEDGAHHAAAHDHQHHSTLAIAQCQVPTERGKQALAGTVRFLRKHLQGVGEFSCEVPR